MYGEADVSVRSPKLQLINVPYQQRVIKCGNENSKVNIHVKTFAETGVVCNANKYVKLTRTLCVFTFW